MQRTQGQGMNVLILTGRFGMGHISAAQAVRDEVLAQEPNAQVKVVDFFDRVSPDFSKTMYRMFNFWTRYCPRLYNKLNAVACHVNKLPLDKKMIARINGLLDEYKPDAVVSTLPFSSQCISTYKYMTGNAVPLYTYITDIVAHEEWVAPQTTGYYVGAQSTKNWLLEYGVEPNKVTVSGIPVRRDFSCEQTGEGGALHDKPEVLIMGGGLGLIPMADEFLSALDADETIHVTLIAGKNGKLKKHIEENFPRIAAVGYTKKPADYVVNADLIVSKSGGITTFEAIRSQTPLLVLRPFLAQEKGNARFIEKEAIGVVVRDQQEDLARTIHDLAHNRAKLNFMACRMRHLAQTWASSPVDWVGGIAPLQTKECA